MSLLIEPTSIGALIVAVIASWTDIRTGKIYNWLTFPGAAIGIVARGVEFGMANPGTWTASALGGVIQAVLGWFTGVMVLLKLFLRQLGHGDTKLMGALGAFVGPGVIFGTFLYFCVIYSVISLAWMASAFPFGHYMATRDLSMVDLTKFNEIRKKAIPIAPFIAGGLLVAIIFKQQTLQFFGLTLPAS
jgi:Flp pilus assembly protein protease CpaA